MFCVDAVAGEGLRLERGRGGEGIRRKRGREG